MTRLKAMDTSECVFTVTVVDGQLTISMPVDAIGDDSFCSWYSENEDKLDRVVSVAIEHNEIESSEVKQQVQLDALTELARRRGGPVGETGQSRD